MSAQLLVELCQGRGVVERDDQHMPGIHGLNVHEGTALVVPEYDARREPSSQNITEDAVGVATLFDASPEMAQRLIDSWNACEGVPAEALERLAEAGGVKTLVVAATERARHPYTVVVNDGLLDLLKAIGPLPETEDKP